MLEIQRYFQVSHSFRCIVYASCKFAWWCTMMHAYIVYHCVSRYAIIILYNICSIEYQQFTCYYVLYIYTLEHMYLLSNRYLHTWCAGIARIAGMLQVISWNCCLDLNETTWHRWVEFSRQVCQVWKSEEYTVFHPLKNTCVAEWISLPQRVDLHELNSGHAWQYTSALSAACRFREANGSGKVMRTLHED